VPRVNKGEPPHPNSNWAITNSKTGPAVDGDPCMQLSPLKLLCGAKGGEDNPEDNRPSRKISKLKKCLIITFLFLYVFSIYKSME
jgi:hypothetical protein